MYGGSVPYGTDNDQANSNFQAVGQTSRHSRKAGVNLRYADPSGQWWVPEPQSKTSGNFARRSLIWHRCGPEVTLLVQPESGTQS